jgi:hypothetical protein
MCDHIPDPGKHRTLFYGAYANRTRGAKGSSEPSPPPAPRLKRCTPCWARLIAYITDSLAIKQILDHLGLWPAEENKAPPKPHEIRAVPVDGEGRQIGEAG